jgi:hypothetical protein
MAKQETLLAQYIEVCKGHGAITEFRAKLLALLPIASGAGIFLILGPDTQKVDTTHLTAIGLFGFFVTFGLFLHELRGIRQCTGLIALGKSLEGDLQLTDGQFTREATYYRRFRVVGPEGAAWLIYPVTLAAWIYVASVPYWI